MWTGVATRRPNELHQGSFPMLEVLILCLAMTVTCYTLVSLFPYVGMMVKDILNLETTNEIGFYVGYVASAFTFGRLLTSYVWGHVTDSFGRKPVIIIGLASMATFSISFGLSRSYTWALSSRLLLGLTNGIVPALRTTLNEVCGTEHVVSGMVYFIGAKGISMILGAGVGGLLAQPALHYPETFSGGLFDRYPFLLPNVVGASFALLVLVLTVIFLPETRDYAATAKQLAGSQQRGRCGNPFGVFSKLVECVLGCGIYNVVCQTVHDQFRSHCHTDSVRLNLSDVSPFETTETARTGLTPLEHTPASSAAGTCIHRNGFQPLTDSSDKERITECRNGNGARGSGGAVSSTATCKGDGDSDCHTDEMTAIRPSASTEEEHEKYERGLGGRGGLLATPHVKVLLFLVCVVQAVQIGLEEAYPLFALSTPDVGGLSWNTVQIGKVFLASGFVVAVWQLFINPPLVKSMGMTTWTRVGGILGIPACLAIPAVKMLSWNYLSLFVVSVIANTGSILATGAMNLALAVGSTTMAPSDMRGKLGGLYNMAESLGRFLGPMGFATMYAWSVSPSTFEAFGGWVNHRFVFQASAAALAVCTAVGWRSLTTENLMERQGGNERRSECACTDAPFGASSESSPSLGLDGSGQQEVGADPGVCRVSTEVGRVDGREADLV